MRPQTISDNPSGVTSKNISEIIESVKRAGIIKTVVELRPIGNIKG